MSNYLWIVKLYYVYLCRYKFIRRRLVAGRSGRVTSRSWWNNQHDHLAMIAYIRDYFPRYLGHPFRNFTSIRHGQGRLAYLDVRQPVHTLWCLLCKHNNMSADNIYLPKSLCKPSCIAYEKWTLFIMYGSEYETFIMFKLQQWKMIR